MTVWCQAGLSGREWVEWEREARRGVVDYRRDRQSFAGQRWRGDDQSEECCRGDGRLEAVVGMGDCGTCGNQLGAALR